MEKSFYFISLGIILTLMAGCSGSPSSPAESERPDLSLNCSSGMSEYMVLDTSLGFCYDPAWGEVAVKDSVGKVGRQVKVSFLDGGPTLYYESVDFEPAQGQEKKADFENFNFSLTQDQITSEMADFFGVPAESMVVRKSDVSGVRAARIDNDGKLEYFVSNTYDGYNLLISWDSDKAGETDAFAFDVVL